jgi:hypothetical protein
MDFDPNVAPVGNADQQETKPAPRPAHSVSRTWTIAAAIVLSLYTGYQARALWHEWEALQEELDGAADHVAVAFPNVYPVPSLAARPPGWIHAEGNAIMLWGGWNKRVGHTWFKVGPADLDPRRMTEPTGRDVLRPIDSPWVELGGGTLWNRLPARLVVATAMLQGVECVYPVPLLSMAGVVNDQVKEHPYLVLFDPGREEEGKVAIFDALSDGQRFTFGNSGYRLDGHAVLYDRESESLWTEDAGALCAVSGNYKGRRLSLAGRTEQSEWGDWRSHHPGARLLIGARAKASATLTAN